MVKTPGPLDMAADRIPDRKYSHKGPAPARDREKGPRALPWIVAPGLAVTADVRPDSGQRQRAVRRNYS